MAAFAATALTLSSALTFSPLGAPLRLRVSTGLRASPCRCCSAAQPITATGEAVAAWCMASSGREEATIAVSPAESIAGAMRDFWLVARTFAEERGNGAGSQRILAFPAWTAAAEAPYFQRVLQHIQDCGNVCEYVGESMLVAGRHPSGGTSEDEPLPAPCPMLLLRSFVRSPGKGAAVSSSESEYDPYAAYTDEVVEVTGGEVADDEEVLTSTRAWVEAVIAHMKVCPFSSTADRAGLPAGGVSYPITHHTNGEGVYEAFWGQCLELAATDERTLSTVLLLTPRFGLHSAEGFDAFADTLNGCLTSLNVEEELQLVFFHPEYTFRDGKARMGDGDDGAANFARRSPYPMINLLRTPQVRKAQKGVPTGSVYTTNERNLQVVGAAELQSMLEARDWTGVYGKQYATHEENTWK